MKIFKLYILKSLCISYLITTLTLTGIIWLSQSLKYIALIIDSGLNIREFVKLTLLMLPSLLIIILPIANFIVTTHIYYKLIVEHELTILMNVGLSKLELSKPALQVAIITTLLNYLLSLYILPTSYQIFKEKLLYYRDNYASVMIEDKVFNSRIKNLTIYVEERQNDGSLKGIFIYDERIPDKPIAMMAERGQFSKSKQGAKLALFEGNRQEINKNGQLDILYFKYFVYDLNLNINNGSTRAKDMQELYITELLNSYDKNNQNKLKAEAHRRLTWPLYNIVLTLMGLFAIYSKTFDRRGHSRRIAIYALLTILIIIGSFIINNLAAQKPALTSLFYMYPLSLIFIAWYLGSIAK